VILAGALIVRTVLDKLDCDELTVSDRGLRHGVLAERFGAPAARQGGVRPKRVMSRPEAGSKIDP
jgi:exopolyphosphatase/guanosine-5'-triphosphate,3'-diphosphate pyrophosphatase